MSQTPISFVDLIENETSNCPEDLVYLGLTHYNRDENSLAALEFFNRAAKLNSAEAKYYLGTIYYFGDCGREINYDKAADFLIQSYNQGYYDSLVPLGWLYEWGYNFSNTSFEITCAKDCYKIALNEHGIERAQKYLDDLLHPKEVIRKVRENTDAYSRLQKLVGLETVKNQIGAIKTRLIFDQKREEAGFSSAGQSHHFLYLGNPGTGKTEVARLMGEIYKDIGFLKEGHVVEVDRGDIVGEYIGQTAILTKEAIHKAIDGILFIDEAHMLCVPGSDRDYGLEAISSLVKAMEDYRDRLIVIFCWIPRTSSIHVT